MGMRIPTRRKTTTVARGSTRGLTGGTNIGVFRTTTSKTAAKERDQLFETKSNRDRGAKTGRKSTSARKLGKTRCCVKRG